MFHHAKVRKANWLYLLSGKNQEGKLALRFIMPESGQKGESLFHQAQVNWLCY
jgi:hypothetical protein